jgi:hypothetical protein
LATYVATLRGFFTFLEKRGDILRNPGLVLELPKSASREQCSARGTPGGS